MREGGGEEEGGNGVSERDRRVGRSEGEEGGRGEE